MTRFYADEHIQRSVVRGLRQRGVDIMTVTEAGLLGAADSEHLDRARTEERIIITRDTDFLRLHASGARHAGIVYAPRDRSAGDIIRFVMLVHQVLAPEDMAGRLEYV